MERAAMDSAASEFAAPAPLARRLPRALGRRLTKYWHRATARQKPPVAEAAFESLARAIGSQRSSSSQTMAVCAATIGRAIVTAALLGEFESAAAWACG